MGLTDFFINIFIILFLLFVNAFFVAAEFSLVKVRKTRLEQLSNEGNSNAKKALKLVNDVNRMLAAAQLGVTIASIALGWVGEATVVRIIEKGAIVKIREGVDAFLPISELSEERVIKVSSVVNIGDIVEAMVIEFKPKNRRMVLSIKEANREPEEDYSEFLKTEDSLGSLGELFKDKFKNLQK